MLGGTGGSLTRRRCLGHEQPHAVLADEAVAPETCVVGDDGTLSCEPNTGAPAPGLPLPCLSPRGLLLGLEIADQTGDQDALGSYELALRNLYPDSAEHRAWMERQSR